MIEANASRKYNRARKINMTENNTRSGSVTIPARLKKVQQFAMLFYCLFVQSSSSVAAAAPPDAFSFLHRVTASDDSANTTLSWFNLEMYPTSLSLSDETTERVLNITTEVLDREFALVYYNFKKFKFQTDLKLVQEFYGLEDLSSSISRERADTSSESRGRISGRGGTRRTLGALIRSRKKEYVAQSQDTSEDTLDNIDAQIELNDQSRYLQLNQNLELGTAVSFIGGAAVFFNQPVQSTQRVDNAILFKGNSDNVKLKLIKALRDTGDSALEDIYDVRIVPFPSEAPSMMPSQYPTLSPSQIPSQFPSLLPSTVPSPTPSLVPSPTPSLTASSSPSNANVTTLVKTSQVVGNDPNKETSFTVVYASIVLGLAFVFVMAVFLKRRKYNEDEDEDDEFMAKDKHKHVKHRALDDDLASIGSDFSGTGNMNAQDFTEYIQRGLMLHTQQSSDSMNLDNYYKNQYGGSSPEKNYDFALNTATAISGFLYNSRRRKNNKNKQKGKEQSEISNNDMYNNNNNNNINNLSHYHIGENGEILFDGDLEDLDEGIMSMDEGSNSILSSYASETGGQVFNSPQRGKIFTLNNKSIITTTTTQDEFNNIDANVDWTPEEWKDQSLSPQKRSRKIQHQTPLTPASNKSNAFSSTVEDTTAASNNTAAAAGAFPQFQQQKQDTVSTPPQAQNDMSPKILMVSSTPQQHLRRDNSTEGKIDNNNYYSEHEEEKEHKTQEKIRTSPNDYDYDYDKHDVPPQNVLSFDSNQEIYTTPLTNAGSYFSSELGSQISHHSHSHSHSNARNDTDQTSYEGLKARKSTTQSDLLFPTSTSNNMNNDDPNKQFINDLVWLDRRMVANNNNTTNNNTSIANIPSPSSYDRSRSISISDDTTVYSSSTRTINSEVSGAGKYTQSISCRDCFAPPGKLKIIIQTTRDGPCVHSVLPGSSLEGHLFPGDLIIAVGNTDTRNLSADQVMKIMQAKSAYERRITVLHFEDMV